MSTTVKTPAAKTPAPPATAELAVTQIPGAKAEFGKFGFVNPREAGAANEFLLRLRAATGSLEWTGSGFAESRARNFTLNGRDAVPAEPVWQSLRQVAGWRDGLEAVFEAARRTRISWPEWRFVASSDPDDLLESIDNYFAAARRNRAERIY